MRVVSTGYRRAMEEIACQCDGLPPHDHRIPNKKPTEMTEAELAEYRTGGKVYEPFHYDPIDIGRLWVDWKAVARDLMTDVVNQGASG